ncbi:sortase [Patescibacteria group bacterium]|nr:sortase [Patescibacteria group bacterium]
MIPLNPHQHRAEYDENGNIILPSSNSNIPQRNEDDISLSWVKGETQWNTQKDARKNPLKNIKIPNVGDAVKQYRKAVHGQLVRTTSGVIREGANQYSFSYRSAGGSLKSAGKHLKRGGRNTLAFLTQPVWVPRRNKEPKEYSRITLFVLDTVRFGGTFTAIFVALFVTLNYQSFWSIVTTRLNPIDHVRSVQALTASVDSALKDKLLRSPSLAVAGSNDGNLLAFLPSIGPPENRIIIPKMELNIPLVTPSYEALLREDWGQVEEDIQDALKMGVVHYPGTAKPGQAGNFFVTGHSSYYPWAPGKYKNVFARLHELEPGDEYWVYYGGDKHRYIVRSKKEVKPSDVTVLDQPVDRRVATLMTCTPIGTTLRRLIITSEEVDPQTGIALEVGERGHDSLPKARPEALPI